MYEARELPFCPQVVCQKYHLCNVITFCTQPNEGGKPPTAKAGSRRRLAVVSVLPTITVEPSRLLSGRTFGTFVSGQKYEETPSADGEISDIHLKFFI